MDKTDERILNSLVADSRLSARQLALRLGLSTVTVISRIRKLEKGGVIEGYTARIDHEKLGYSLTAIIEIIARKEEILKVEDRLSGIENVCGVYDVTGSTDILVIAKFKDRAEMSQFVKGLSSIPNVENTITHLVLNTVKEDFRLT